MIELTCCDMVICNEASMPEITRDDIAQTYAMALVSSWPTDWKKANAAILERWSKSGLEYIKVRAWKIVEENRKRQTEHN